MNRVSKYTSLSIITLSLFACINTHCMENDDATTQYFPHQMPKQYSYSEIDLEKNIATAVDQLFDEIQSAHAEKFLSSLTDSAERIIVAKTAHELILTKNPLSQKKALHAFILLNSHPIRDEIELGYAQKCARILIDEGNVVNNLEVLKKLIELETIVNRRVKECIRNNTTQINQESSAIRHQIEKINNEDDDDCACTLF